MRVPLKRVKALRPGERDVVRRVLTQLRRHAENTQGFEHEIKGQLERMDLLARCLRESPSLYEAQRIGERRRDVHSLISALVNTTVFDFEMHMPMRALIGRTLLMAKLNFFRLLRHIMSEEVPSTAAATAAAGDIEQRLCNYIYTKIAEEILARICTDNQQEGKIRKKAVAMICQIWEHRPYGVADFFPILTSVWEARREAKVVFGTLMGTAELFELIRAGIADRFLDMFSSSHITDDMKLAFNEFLFMTSGPELDRLRTHLDEQDASLSPTEAAELLNTEAERFDLTSHTAEKMYESFRRRGLAAVTRRIHGGHGASKTAEEYIMIHLLDNSDLDDLIEARNGESGD